METSANNYSSSDIKIEEEVVEKHQYISVVDITDHVLSDSDDELQRAIEAEAKELEIILQKTKESEANIELLMKKQINRKVERLLQQTNGSDMKGVQMIYCEICKVQIHNDIANFKEHLDSEHPDPRVFEISVNDKVVTIHVDVNMQLLYNSDLKCFSCNEVFKNRALWSQHYFKPHHICKKCGFKFPKCKSLSVHKSHNLCQINQSFNTIIKTVKSKDTNHFSKIVDSTENLKSLGAEKLKECQFSAIINPNFERNDKDFTEQLLHESDDDIEIIEPKVDEPVVLDDENDYSTNTEGNLSVTCNDTVTTYPNVEIMNINDIQPIPVSHQSNKPIKIRKNDMYKVIVTSEAVKKPNKVSHDFQSIAECSPSYTVIDIPRKVRDNIKRYMEDVIVTSEPIKKKKKVSTEIQPIAESYVSFGIPQEVHDNIQNQMTDIITVIKRNEISKDLKTMVRSSKSCTDSVTSKPLKKTNIKVFNKFQATASSSHTAAKDMLTKVSDNIQNYMPEVIIKSESIKIEDNVSNNFQPSVGSSQSYTANDVARNECDGKQNEMSQDVTSELIIKEEMDFNDFQTMAQSSQSYTANDMPREVCGDIQNCMPELIVKSEFIKKEDHVPNDFQLLAGSSQRYNANDVPRKESVDIRNKIWEDVTSELITKDNVSIDVQPSNIIAVTDENPGHIIEYSNKPWLRINNKKSPYEGSSSDLYIPKRILNKSKRYFKSEHELICQKCLVPFPTFDELIEHISTAENCAILNCAMCDYMSHTQEELDKHKNYHKKSMYFKVKFILPSGEAKWGFKCKECGITVDNEVSNDHFAMHYQATKSKEVKAIDRNVVHNLSDGQVTSLFDFLKKEFKDTDNLFCVICLSKFDTISNMKRHGIEHLFEDAVRKKTEDNNLTCQQCNDQFRSTMKYKRHMLNRHAFYSENSPLLVLNTNCNRKARLICSLCKRRFWTKKMLSLHIKSHTDTPQKVINCYFCPATFEEFSTFKEHIVVEHKIRRLTKKNLRKQTCNICQMTFRGTQDKLDHIWHVHKYRNIKVDCLYCPHQFRLYTDLKRHVIYCHRSLPVPEKQYFARIRRGE